MAILRVKRRITSPNIGNDALLPGELGVSYNSLAFGPKAFSADDTAVTAIYVAAQNHNNLFTGKNQFRVNTDSNFEILNNSGLAKTYGKTDGFLYSTADTSTIDTADGQILVNRNYVEAKIQGLHIKTAVRAATTANISLTGIQTVDGVVLVADNRVLVKNQNTKSQNGIYIVSSGTWTRAEDANTWSELVSAFVFVEQGTSNKDRGFVCTVDAGGALETTDIEWTQFSSAGSYTNGNGLLLSGNIFSVNFGGNGSSNLVARADHNHGGTTRATNPLTGAYVFSDIETSNGIVTHIGTRQLTAANIGAEPAFSKNTAFNKSFGTTSGTVAEGNHLHSQYLTGITKQMVIDTGLAAGDIGAAITGHTHTSFDTVSIQNLTTTSFKIKHDTLNGYATLEYSGGSANSTFVFPPTGGTIQLAQDDIAASRLTGTIPSAVLGNSSVYIGTTAIALNRASGALTLSGVSISGNAGTVTNGVYTTGNQTIGGTKTFSSTISGSINGSSASIVTAQKSNNVPYQVPFVSSVTAGAQNLYTDSAAHFTYNPSTNTVTASFFEGTIDGGNWS